MSIVSALDLVRVVPKAGIATVGILLLVLASCAGDDPSDPSDDAESDVSAFDAESDADDVARFPDVVADTDECLPPTALCAGDGECCSGFCIEGAGDEGSCATSCSRSDAECGPGEECVETPTGDGVARICLPFPTCSACSEDGQCGGSDDACIAIIDGSYCFAACDDDDDCPEGLRCDGATSVDGVVATFCLPTSELCSGCLDRDEDERGDGPDCIDADGDGEPDRDCDDDDPTTYFGAAEACDGVDNDCDDEVDEGFEDALNECGGCGDLDGTPGETCGACDTGTWICETDVDAVSCVGEADEAENACGGCEALDGAPGDSCGECGDGELICASPELLSCVGASEARNECGGCGELSGELGASCGACDSGSLICDDTLGDVVCDGDLGEDALNACDGCSELTATPGGSCGPCDLDEWTCDGEGAVECSGATAANACGGCSDLPELGSACGRCGDGEIECDGDEAVECVGATTSCGFAVAADGECMRIDGAGSEFTTTPLCRARIDEIDDPANWEVVDRDTAAIEIDVGSDRVWWREDDSAVIHSLPIEDFLLDEPSPATSTLESVPGLGFAVDGPLFLWFTSGGVFYVANHTPLGGATGLAAGARWVGQFNVDEGNVFYLHEGGSNPILYRAHYLTMGSSTSVHPNFTEPLYYAEEGVMYAQFVSRSLASFDIEEWIAGGRGVDLLRTGFDAIDFAVWGGYVYWVPATE